MTRPEVKSTPDRSNNWLLSVEPAWRALSKDPVFAADPNFASASAEYGDLLAETSAEVAGQYLKSKDLAKYRVHIDRAVEMKHSTKHATFAVNRAVNFKKNEAAIGMSADEMTAVRQQAVAAIESAEPAVRAMLRKELDAGWPK